MKLFPPITIAIVVSCSFAFASFGALKGGDVDPTFSPGSSVNGPVYSLALQTNGQVLIGGGLGGGVARLNSDGSWDTNFQNGLDGAAGEVDSIVLQPDGKAIIGGYFNAVSGVDRGGIARLNTDGTPDTGFQDGMAGAIAADCITHFPYTCTYYLGQVNSLALQSGTNVFVGGFFNQFNAPFSFHSGIVRLNANGSVSTNFQDHFGGGNVPGAPIPNVFSTALQSDGKVIIGGDFGIARLNPDGRRDTNFLAVVDHYVNSVVIQPDGKVLIAGQFATVDGTSRTNVARLNSNGTLDNSFVVGTDDRVFRMALQSDGKVLLGGLFLSVNGEPRSHIARLNSNGTVDTSFLNGQTGADEPVVALALQPDGRILVGGEFTAFNGVSVSYVTRLYGSAPLLLGNSRVVANQFGFSVSGESNQVVVVEASTDLSNWLPLKTNILGGGPLSFSDPASVSSQKRFYRVRSE